MAHLEALPAGITCLDSNDWNVYPDSRTTMTNVMNYVMMMMGMLLVLMVSCHETSSPPKQTLSEERFQSVYVSLLEEGERHRNLRADSGKHFNADSIFRAFNTSEQEFRSTIASYRSDPENWQRFYETVIKRLDEKQKQQGTISKP